ncbi:hypothetical protein ACJBU6_02553 [Exserohilum turcicum]
MSQQSGSRRPYDPEREHRRRKRYRSRSDEEIQQEMDVRAMPYRVGWPKLPPLPLHTVIQGAFESVEDAASKLQEANIILEAQGIHNVSVLFTYRIPRDEAETDDLSQYLTLTCNFDTTANAHKLLNAVIRLRSMLEQFESTAGAHVECIDYRPIRTFTIQHSELDIRKKWEEATPILLQILEHHEWLSMEMIRRGLEDTPDKCPPTIVIATPTARDPKWHGKVLLDIVTAVDKIAPNFVVEILCGVSLLGDTRHQPSNTIDSTSYEKVLRMGSSIGIHGEDVRCSTLGGAVILEGGVKCGITNWYCVRDDRLDKSMASSNLINVQADSNTVFSKTNDGTLKPGNKTLLNAPQRIVSPGTCDHVGYLVSLQRNIQGYKQAFSQGVGYAHDLQREAEKEYMTTYNTNRGVGHVYAGSGRGVVKANKDATDKSKEKTKHLEREYLFPLDWALIRMDNVQQRDIINRLPEAPPPRQALVGRARPCPKWSVFDVNRETVRVAKYGRTSGWTLGTINACMSLINTNNDQDIASIYGFTNQTPGYCFVVTSSVYDRPFMESGDSGSILLRDGSGTQLGLLFGVTVTGEGMFIPLDLVYQDIRKVTGKQVVEPAYTGKWASIQPRKCKTNVL